MKKELSKKELKEKEIKKAKLIMSLKKVLNIVCYVCTALFLVFCVALGVGSCNNRNKAKQSNYDLIGSSQVIEDNYAQYQKGFNRSDLVNDYYTSKSLYDSLFYNYRNQQLSYNTSNATFWRDIEFGIDVDGLLKFYAYSFNDYIKNQVDMSYNPSNYTFFAPYISIKGGFKVHNASSGTSTSYQFFSFENYGFASDDFVATYDSNYNLLTSRIRCYFDGGQGGSYFDLFDFDFDFVNWRIIKMYAPSNYLNQNYYFTYDLNLYGLNTLTFGYYNNNIDYIDFVYRDTDSSINYDFSLTSSDGAINSFVDNRENFLIYCFGSEDLLYYSRNLDLFDFSIKFLPIQFYHYQLPFNCPNLSDFVFNNSFFGTYSNINVLESYLIPYFSNCPFYSNGSFYNEMRLDFKRVDLGNNGTNDTVYAFYYYDSSEGKWIYDSQYNNYQGLLFVDSLVFDFWLDRGNDTNYYYDKVIQLNNATKIGRSDFPFNESGLNIEKNTRLINSYDYYSNGFNDIYVLQIHNFSKSTLLNHEANTIYDNLANFNYIDNSISAISLTNVFDLFKNGFSKLYGFFSWAILPGITLGTLLFMPLIVSIIVIVFRAVKK